MKLFSNPSSRGRAAQLRSETAFIPGLKTIWFVAAMVVIDASPILASEPSDTAPAPATQTTAEMQSKAAAALAAAMGTSGTDSMALNDSAQTSPPAVAPAAHTNTAAKPSNPAPAPVTPTTMQMRSEVAAPAAVTMNASGASSVAPNNPVNPVKTSSQAMAPAGSARTVSGASSPAPAPVTQTTAEKQSKAAIALTAAMNASDTDLVAQNDSVTATPQSVTHAAPTNGDYISTNAMELLDNSYKLAIGDSITFQILEDEDDPKTVPVQDSGDVEIPYIGRFPAAGKTCKQLAKQLKVELEKKYYYRATVVISVNAMITHGIVYIVGGVKAPGPLEIPRDDVLTISKAILRAGGFDDFADQKHVRVTRRGDDGTNEVLTVNVGAVLNNGQTDKDVKAEPGDLIYVPEKTVHF